jgi:hypothetical protein
MLDCRGFCQNTSLDVVKVRFFVFESLLIFALQVIDVDLFVYVHGEPIVSLKRSVGASQFLDLRIFIINTREWLSAILFPAAFGEKCSEGLTTEEFTGVRLADLLHCLVQLFSDLV